MLGRARESPPISIVVGNEKAELKGLFVLTHPYPSLGRTSDVEAIVQGLRNSEGLKLEFWAKTPKNVSEELAKIEIKKLSAGEEAQYSTHITFKEKGYHTIHAYLYDENKRIGYRSDTVLVR
jgi:hypothetical protein